MTILNKMTTCMICGDLMNSMYSVKLECPHSHEFHYECILKTYTAIYKSSHKYRNHCPYCREKSGLLPIVNGLTKAVTGIHYVLGQEPPDISKVRCQHTLTKGIRKGELCDKKCQLGYTLCKVHQKATHKSKSQI